MVAPFPSPRTVGRSEEASFRRAAPPWKPRFFCRYRGETRRGGKGGWGMDASLDGPRGPAREVLQWRIINHPSFLLLLLSISCRQQCRLSEQIWTRRVDRENSTQAKTSKEKREMLDRWSCRAARRIGGRLGLTDSSLRRAKRLSSPPPEEEHGDGDQSEWVTYQS